jgi:hypothetical protein
MKRLLVLFCVFSLLIVPFSALAGDSSNSKYARIYDSNRQFSVEVKAHSGIVSKDARIVIRLKSNEENSWISADLGLDGHCDFGARNCGHWMDFGTAVDAGHGEGWSENTIYANEILGRRPSVREEPWGNVLIEFSDGYYLLGYKLSKKSGNVHIKFVRISETKSRLKWKSGGSYYTQDN